MGRIDPPNRIGVFQNEKSEKSKRCRILSVLAWIIVIFALQNAATEPKAQAKLKGQSFSVTKAVDDRRDGFIKPYHKNPWYWEYNGEPILLIGAGDEDNLFQWSRKELIGQLDLLKF